MPKRASSSITSSAVSCRRIPSKRIDENGVAKLMGIAVELGRKARPGLEVGICGEHGGDPKSIAICHKLGLNYVSCSPFRVPIE